MMKITPYSQFVNITIFVLFSLLTFSFVTVSLQTLLILVSLVFFKVTLKDIRIRDFLPLLPILLFVFSLNCMRGGGEIIARFGPFLVVKQGIVRGLYYSIVIGELFIMSKLIAKGFPQELLISTLYSIDLSIPKKGRVKGVAEGKPSASLHRYNRSVFLVLFYTLKIFEAAYSEMRLFFSRNSNPLKDKIVRYFSSVFEKSLREYENLDSIEVERIKPVFFDYVYISLQILLLSFTFILKRQLS